MKPLVALLVCLSLAGCFPNSAKHRTYAKAAEGAALVAGIAMLYTVNSGADCDEMRGFGTDDAAGCRDNAQLLGGIGLGLIFAGLAGFIVTVSTSPEDAPEPPANTLGSAPVTKTTPVTPAGNALK